MRTTIDNKSVHNVKKPYNGDKIEQIAHRSKVRRAKTDPTCSNREENTENIGKSFLRRCDCVRALSHRGPEKTERRRGTDQMISNRYSFLERGEDRERREEEGERESVREVEKRKSL